MVVCDGTCESPTTTDISPLARYDGEPKQTIKSMSEWRPAKAYQFIKCETRIS